MLPRGPVVQLPLLQVASPNGPPLIGPQKVEQESERTQFRPRASQQFVPAPRQAKSSYCSVATSSVSSALGRLISPVMSLSARSSPPQAEAKTNARRSRWRCLSMSELIAARGPKQEHGFFSRV